MKKYSYILATLEKRTTREECGVKKQLFILFYKRGHIKRNTEWERCVEDIRKGTEKGLTKYGPGKGGRTWDLSGGVVRSKETHFY